MADKALMKYIKDDDGTLKPVAVVYDKNGNDIAETYVTKAEAEGIGLSYDEEGYIVIDDSETAEDNVD